MTEATDPLQRSVSSASRDLEAAATGRCAATTFVLGGARSGKSRYAEQLAHDFCVPVTYIATARRAADDQEFLQRIAQHRERRPSTWEVVESGVALADALDRAQKHRPERCVLIDCLTLWLVQLLCPLGSDAPVPGWQAHRDAFLDALRRAPNNVIVVSNEIGLGVVPLGAVSRLYVDELGSLNQAVAGISTRVVLTVAGIPLTLK